MNSILHILPDDKFAGFVNQEFSNIANTIIDYLCIDQKNDFKYINFPCKYIWDGKDNTLMQIVKEVNKYKIVVIHFLSVEAQKLLEKINKNVIVIWIGWGGDYYWLIDTLSDFKMYKRLTAEFLNSNQSFFSKRLKYFLRYKKLNPINRINYFSPVLEVEYSKIKKNYPNFKPQLISWNYGNVQDNYIKGLAGFKMSGNSLIIGNSATATNNHLDIFHILKLHNLSDNFDKIYLPLSYGNSDYKDNIAKKATEMFENITIMQDFIPYESYLEVLKTCSNVIMGHIRQQGMGNIIALLYLGAKIFFFKESIIYNDLIKKGYRVFTMEDLQNKLLIHNQLDSETVLKHRHLLNNEWGKEINKKNTIDICSL